MRLIHHVTPSIFLSGETSVGRVKGYPLILAGLLDTLFIDNPVLTHENRQAVSSLIRDTLVTLDIPLDQFSPSQQTVSIGVMSTRLDALAACLRGAMRPSPCCQAYNTMAWGNTELEGFLSELHVIERTAKFAHSLMSVFQKSRPVEELPQHIQDVIGPALQGAQSVCVYDCVKSDLTPSP